MGLEVVLFLHEIVYSCSLFFLVWQEVKILIDKTMNNTQLKKLVIYFFINNNPLL